MSVTMVQPFAGDAEIAEFARAAQSSCAEAAGAKDPRGLAATLARDGLTGVIASETAGGLGLPLRFAQPVLWAAGEARLAFPLVETLAAVPLLEAALPEAAAGVVAGTEIVTGSMTANLSLAEGMISGKAAGVPLASEARWLVAPVGTSLALVDLTEAPVVQSVAEAIDPVLPRATLVVAGHPVTALVGRGDLVDDWRARTLVFRAVDAAACAAAATGLAIDFLTPRTQFGRPLITFQALRHDLARAKMQLESLNRLIEAALQAETPSERLAAAELAYAHAAAATPAVVEMALHMHGGMGFTWDVPVHLYLRRLRDGFGACGAGWARARVAERVLAEIVQG